MSLEWKSCKIGDVVSVRRGASPRPIKDYVSEKGMPWVKIADATKDQTRFINFTSEFIKEEGIEKSVVVNPGDLIVSNSATPGLPKFMNIKACVHDGWLVFDNYDGILKDFLYYYFIVIRGRLVNQANGSVFKNLKTDIVRDFDINLPDIETQEKIVNILSQIDKKIEINIDINKNLDELCHLIFKYYFIDFIPFQNNEFTDTEIGEIPKGWNITTVGDILDCKLGGTPSRSNEDYWGGDIAWINSGKVNEFRILDASEYITELGLKKSATKLLPAKTTVIAITGATLGQISLLEIDSCANQSVIGVIPNNKYPYEFVYPLISSILFELLKHQTGGAQQHINKNNVESFTIVCPPEDIISEYKNIVSSLYSQISKNCFEIENLTKLRDTLLPKLMSGEIDVSKINYDLTLRIMKFILNPPNYLNRGINMKTKIISKIQNQMKEYLNPDQYIKLTNSLLNSLQDVDIIDNNNELCEKDNFKLLDLFLSAKQVEGRSPKTITYYKSTIEKMLVKIKKQIYNINTDDLRKYLFDHKNEKQSSKTTIDNIRRILSSFFSWLEDEDYILKNPVRRIHKVKTGRTVKEVLTDENLETLRDKCDEIRDLAMLELLISTGIRVGELVRLNISDIDFYERECVVFGKGESERIVYFDARTKIHLMQYIQQRTDENPALFVSLNKPNTRLGISGIETRLRELGEKCNIKKVHPHKFRRTMATNAIDKGMPIEQVQKLLGHVQIDTTMQYAMVNQSNVKHAHRKFIG